MQRPDRVATETLPFKVFFTFKITEGLKQQLEREKHTIGRNNEFKEKDKTILSLEKGTKNSKTKTSKSLYKSTKEGNVPSYSHGWNTLLIVLKLAKNIYIRK